MVFFKHDDLAVAGAGSLKRMPFNAKNLPATYHAFYDPATGVPKPNDGRPVHGALRPEFVWPKGA